MVMCQAPSETREYEGEARFQNGNFYRCIELRGGKIEIVNKINDHVENVPKKLISTFKNTNLLSWGDGPVTISH